VEAGTAAESFAPALEAMGSVVEVAPVDSEPHAVAITPGDLLGSADLRREGVGVGE
jgi:gamma-glutamyltranspeptidase / glutathione hydrolase